MLIPHFVKALFRLDNRIVLLTGATGYLGQTMAWGLAQAGAHVVLSGRNVSKLEPMVQAMRSQGHTASYISGDLTEKNTLDTIADQVKNHWGRLDVLVNNAYPGTAGSWQDISADDFEQAHWMASYVPFHLLQLLHPYLQQAATTHPGGASVINVASMYGKISPDPRIYRNSGENNPPQYGAAKASLLQMTRYMACHLGPQRIRVNAISPGPFPQPEVHQQSPQLIQALAHKAPMARVGHPKELIGALLFLASDASSYITGADIPVDGGWSAW